MYHVRTSKFSSINISCGNSSRNLKSDSSMFYNYSFYRIGVVFFCSQSGSIFFFFEDPEWVYFNQYMLCMQNNVEVIFIFIMEITNKCLHHFIGSQRKYAIKSYHKRNRQAHTRDRTCIPYKNRKHLCVYDSFDYKESSQCCIHFSFTCLNGACDVYLRLCGVLLK